MPGLLLKCCCSCYLCTVFQFRFLNFNLVSSSTLPPPYVHQISSTSSQVNCKINSSASRRHAPPMRIIIMMMIAILKYRISVVSVVRQSKILFLTPLARPIRPANAKNSILPLAIFHNHLQNRDHRTQTELSSAPRNINSKFGKRGLVTSICLPL